MKELIALLKKILVKLKPILGSGVVKYLILGLILIALFVQLYLFFKKGKKGKIKKPKVVGVKKPKFLAAAEKETATVEEPEEQQELLPRSSLIKVWQEFLNEIPREFRRSILLYDHFVVLGDSGSGKSVLIDNGTDWQGQALQFYPSYTVNPLLQLYLGSEVIVQEIPAAILNDTSKQARVALQKLWKPIYRKKEPTVVVVVSATALQENNPEALKRQAQMIRGKINLLSQLGKKPIKVCIALTFMNQVEGFQEFSDFLRKYDIQLKLELKSEADLQKLPSALEPYEKYLPQALTTCEAEDYLKIISFFKQAPEILQTLTRFVKFLKAQDALSYTPEITRICLASRQEGESRISNPFVPSGPKVWKGFSHPHWKHRFAAAVCCFLGIVYLGGGFLYEYNLLKDTDQALDNLEAAPPPLSLYEQEVHKLFLDFSISMKKDPLLAILPNFFPTTYLKIHQRLIEDVRKFYLNPQLTDLAGKMDTEGKTLYLLGLLYATKDNELGKLVMKNAGEWQRIFALPEMLVADYARNNLGSKELDYDLTTMDYWNLKGISPLYDPLPWTVYFRKLEKLYNEAYITPNDLIEMREEAEYLLEMIREFSQYNLSVKIAGFLRKEASITIPAELHQMRELEVISKEVVDFLSFIRGLQFEKYDVAGLNLTKMMEHVKAMRDINAVRSDRAKEFQFSFVEKAFVYNVGKWHDLVLGSKIVFLLRDFITLNKKNDGLLFFQGKDYNGEEFSSSLVGDGQSFLIKTGKLDGRFTRKAFMREVMPVLQEMPAFLDSLPIVTKEKTRFANFIFKEVKAYAASYSKEYIKYYQNFKLGGENSLGELRYVLSQMQLPSSPFMEFLLTVKKNTILELDDTPYFRPIAAEMNRFSWIGRLLADRQDSIPEMEKYFAILAQMQNDIEASEPVSEENEADDARHLKKKLSPVGRLGLTIFRSESTSYLNMITMWLNSVNITHDWQDPFLAPVLHLYDLGRDEIETATRAIWNELEKTQVNPVLKSFPFDQQAESSIDPEQLQKSMRPDGFFWSSFRDFLAPLCVQTDRGWQPRSTSLSKLKLPENMLSTVNKLAGITARLWDEKGDPRPLKFMMKPYPLPARESDQPIVVLSYFRAGGSAVFGFNQQPAWKEISYNWWQKSIASVGVEFAAEKSKPRKYAASATPEIAWSLYRMLRRAEVGDENTLSWNIDDTFPLTVKFTLKTDPWRVLQ